MKQALLIAAATAALYAQPGSSAKQTQAYMQSLADRITASAVEEVSSRDRWEPVAEKRREEMRKMLGLMPWPRRTPLNVRVTGKLDRRDYTVEKLAFESMPRVYVTANLYVPKKRDGRVPAIVYVCGHSYSPQGAKAQYQRHGISFAKNGYVAIILDPIQIAETYSLHHGVHSQEMYDWYSRGYTPAGIETWNAMRAIDYLETRPEVDPGRIGMTGRSGGAAMTWFTAAVDLRVKAAMPVMGISTYAANVARNTQRLHCDCMFPINGYTHDMMHQAALIAPRPLLMGHGRLDALFPVPGYTAVESAMKKLYASYGKPGDFGNVVVETDHKDSDFLREQSIRFFDKHLLGQSDRKLDMAYENEPPEQLAVFDTPPAGSQNYRLHEIFTPTPAFGPFKTLAAWEKRRSELLEHLRNDVFRVFPRDVTRPEVKRGAKTQGMDDLDIETDPGVHVRALLTKPEKAEPAPVLLYIASDGEDVRAASQLLSSVRRNDAVKLILYPRGISEIPWDKSTWKDMQRNAMHVGHTVDSMRLWDVLRAVAAIRAEAGVDPKRVTLMGTGQSAILALYAAVLDTSVEQVTLIDPPDTHVTGPHFLNVLRYTDVPEAVALVAPRRVNFYKRTPPALAPASAVYRLYGHPDHLWTTMSFSGPVLHRYDHNFSSGY